MAEAAETDREVRARDLRVLGDEAFAPVDLAVVPVAREAGDRHFLIVFEERDGAAAAPPERRAEAPPPDTAEESERVRELERELAETRSQLQSTIRDLEGANEKLQSANEEVLASNEELQSTNEELNTAKEELESSNEELTTVNEELKARNEELRQANSDLENLLANVDIPVVILDAGLAVRRYTPAAERLLGLVPEDVGRPIGRTRPQLEVENIEAPLRQALDAVTTVEREVRDLEGRWHRLRTRPYRDAENRIDGAVLTLFDIHDAKRRAEDLAAAQAFAEGVLETLRQPLVVLDEQLCVRMLNRSFCETFGVDRNAAHNAYFYRIQGGRWDIPELRRLLDEVLPHDVRFEAYPVEVDFPELGRRRLLLNARRLDATVDGRPMILLAMEEATPEEGGSC